MGEAEQFGRIDLSRGEEYQIRPDSSDPGRNGNSRYDAKPGFESRPLQNGQEPVSRPLGAPLPMGSGKSANGSAEGQAGRGAAPPGRALSMTPRAEAEQNSGMQWAMGVMKQAVPFVQKLLPLLDGQIATAVANLLVARPHSPPPPPKLDLQPLENSLTEIQVQHRELKEQLIDQNTSLKKVEDQLDMVREATDRNTLEQQELIEDLKIISNRINLMALLFLGLLAVSVLLNIFLFLHIQRVLP